MLNLLPNQTNISLLLFLQIKQLHLVKLQFFHFERQRVITRAFKQQMVSRLLAVTQAFHTQNVERCFFRCWRHDFIRPGFRSRGPPANREKSCENLPRFNVIIQDAGNRCPDTLQGRFFRFESNLDPSVRQSMPVQRVVIILHQFADQLSPLSRVE